MSKIDWIRVSKSNPCPICQKPDNCSVSIDGNAVWCGRESRGSIRSNKGGQFLHRRNERSNLSLSFIHKPKVEKTRALSRENPKHKAKWTDSALRDLYKLIKINEVGAAALALNLGLTCVCLRKHFVGSIYLDSIQQFDWYFAERDGYGNFVGFNIRFQFLRKVHGKHLSKKQLSGSKRGLFYSDQNFGGHGMIVFVVEGASDVIALNDIEIPAIGRPSNRMGAVDLVTLMERYPSHQFVLVGENDEKEDGTWPGKDGCEALAEEIFELSRQRVVCVFPPDGAKDIRNWLV